LVDYKEGVKAYRSCTFKKMEDQSTVSYTPSDITGYGLIEGKFFESTEIKEGDQMQNLVFVEVKVKGVVSLYKFDNSFFVKKNGDTLTRL